MHASLQSGGRSPKPINVPTSNSPLRPGSDNLQNNMASFPSQVKGKKRERTDHGSDSVKRERSVKVEDVDSAQHKTESIYSVKRERSVKVEDVDFAQHKTESILKFEFSKITEKGGLVDSEGVEKLVQLMQPEKLERRIDLTCRSMIAQVLAATDRIECLHRFVQLRGLPVLDEWLQDIHKGKFSSGNTSKDNDKSVEEFLLVLLRALDKLPVNLHALQMCNIGRSVNHLRTHKNMEIQKKARSLVDTWKKRVEVEMNMIDAKSGLNQGVSWPPKSRLAESSHGINKTIGGSSDITTKSSITQLSASKTASPKISQGETAMKSLSSSHGLVKSLSPSSSKEGHLRSSAVGISDVPAIREDKSSSSSHSHNHSQSFSGKEDARSSTAGSKSAKKISGGGTRCRKSTTAIPGASASIGQKDVGLSQSSSLHRNLAPEKVSQSVPTGEKARGPVVEGSSHKLIVKIPNKVRSPGAFATGGSSEDPPIMSSQASSPVLSERNNHIDGNLKETNDAFQSNIPSDVNTESWQSSDFKDVLSGSDESDGSPVFSNKEPSTKIGGTQKPASKDASSSSGNESKAGKAHEASFSSMHALIESCVKYSEANTSMSPNDVVGMNLLASVATEEMSKSRLISPTDSPNTHTQAVDAICMDVDSKSMSPPQINSEENRGGSHNYGSNEMNIAENFQTGEGLNPANQASFEISGERKHASHPSGETIPTGEHDKPSAVADLKLPAPCPKINENCDQIKVSADCSSASMVKVSNGETSKQTKDEKLEVSSMRIDGIGTSTASFEGGAENNHVDQEPSAVVMNLEVAEKIDKGMKQVDCSNNELNPERTDKFTIESLKKVDKDTPHLSENQKSDQAPKGSAAIESEDGAEMGVAVTGQGREYIKVAVESKVLHDHNGESHLRSGSPAFANAQETEKVVMLGESKLSEVEVNKKDQSSPFTGLSSPAVVVSDVVSKVKFDLNEGLVADEGKFMEPITVSRFPSTMHLLNPLPHGAPLSTTFPPSITVAAAAKGPFVPPDDLLKYKGEIGWKGSAATSAFRPAEPRKLEITPSSANLSLSDASANKHSRPPLDFDLNVPDERILEEMASLDSTSDICSTSDVARNRSQNDLSGSAPPRSSGLDLDLNRIDEAIEMGQCSVSSSRRLEDPAIFVKSSSSNGRNFDLNDGPGDDANAELSSFSQNVRVSLHSQLPISGLRMNHPEMGSFSSWFPPGNTYSNVTIPSILPERGDQSFSVLPPGAQQGIIGPPGGNTHFTPDAYRGSVLSSSPAVPFPSGPFQYPVFPFGTSFPLPSVTFPGGSSSYMDPSSGGRLFTPQVNSQLLGPAVSPQYPRPYMVGLPEGLSNSGIENSRKWNRQGLDLNAGPGSIDIDGREESLPSASRQLSVANSQTLTEEQLRMYSMMGGVSKRKEPEGGLDSENFRYKQSSWQ